MTNIQMIKVNEYLNEQSLNKMTQWSNDQMAK